MSLVSTLKHTLVYFFLICHIEPCTMKQREEGGQLVAERTLKCLCLTMTVSLSHHFCTFGKTAIVDLSSLHFLKVLTFQMVPTDGVQAVVHPGEGVNGSLCVHILLPSPHVHYGVVTVEPGDILSIVNSSCSTRTHSHGFSSMPHTLYHSI